MDIDRAGAMKFLYFLEKTKQLRKSKSVLASTENSIRGYGVFFLFFLFLKPPGSSALPTGDSPLDLGQSAKISKRYS